MQPYGSFPAMWWPTSPATSRPCSDDIRAPTSHGFLVVLVISLVSLYIDGSTGATCKRRCFKVLATVFFLVPCVAVVDAFLGTADTMHYIRDEGLYNRPPNDFLSENNWLTGNELTTR
jgi:hypothetical protein